jgi:hypothetical protein
VGCLLATAWAGSRTPALRAYRRQPPGNDGGGQRQR